MKKALLWIIGILAALCLAVWFIWGGEIASISSVKSVDGINEKGLCTSIMALPKQASQQDTQYSNVYDQSAITLRLRNWNDYETTQQFSL